MVKLQEYLDMLYSKYMNLSIKHKIQLFFYSIIILVSVIFGSYSYITSSRIVQNEVSSVNLRDTKQISSSIDFLQRDVNELSTFICLDSDVQSFIRSNATSLDNGQHNVNIPEPLTSLLASKSYISFISIYAKDGSQFYLSSDTSIGVSSYETIKQSTIYKKALELRGTPMWIPLNEQNQIFITQNKFPKIAMIRSILDTNTYKESGFMVICINLPTLQRIYSSSTKTPGSYVMILDESNNIISNSDPNNGYGIGSGIPELTQYIDEYEGKEIITFNNKRMLLTYNTVDESKWKVAYLVPVEGLLKHLDSITSVTLYVILACMIISFIISTYISHILTSPIKKLLVSMNRVKKGDFKEKVDFKFNDEIGMLGLEYNDMIDNIHDLINKAYKLQIREKEAELKALQAQINPHFLYNTLDTIFWKAEKSRQKDISEMVYALSRLFRITLNRGNEFIQVRGEKEFIEHYLLLQSRRFRDKLSYEINIDEDILDYLMPKLILQPFVENSIIHGTEADNSKSFIRVSGTHKDERLIFSIEDDGSGMSGETVRELLNPSRKNPKADSKTKGGYAIGNVKQRLELYYGHDYRLDIISQVGHGTRVEIEIPVRLQDNSEVQ